MFGIIIIVITVIVLGIMLWQPKWAPVLLWPVLFMYPHAYLFERQLLPLNIGIDDLFICAFFIFTVIRRNMMGGIRPQFGYAVWATFLFFIILIVSNANGYFVVGRIDLEGFVKAALKGAIPFLLAYGLVNTIDDEEDVKRIVFSFCFFAAAGGMLVILQNYFPRPMQIFGQFKQLERVLAGYDIRPSGAFQNANNAAIVMGTASLIIVCTLSLQSRHFNKTTRFICLGIMVLAILLTRSRSGFLSIIIPLVLMSVMGKNKRYAWLFLCLGIVAITAFTGIRGALFERFSGTGEQVGFIAPIKLRLAHSIELWREVTFRRLLFGESAHTDILMERGASHNLYFGIPLNYGILGTVWAISVVTIMLRKARFLLRYVGSSLASYGSAIRWCLLVFALYGIAGSILGSYYGRYTVALLLAVIQKCVDIAWQNSSEYDYESYMYIDQAEYVEYLPV